MNPKVISMRIESEESDRDEEVPTNSSSKRQKMLLLPPAIKTEESQTDNSYSELKKKV